MALVLVMFPGLQQPGLHESSRVNITICKGIQTHNTPHFHWIFSSCASMDRDNMNLFLFFFLQVIQELLMLFLCF